MNLTANVIGATGLVGKQLVLQLLEDKHFKAVRIFVRRDAGIHHQKLEQHLVDFSKKETWEDQLTGDVLFSALGTTLKQAGSKEKEYEVDFTFNLSFARTARENGIRNYVLVSAVGANAKSRIFYSRIKGELDDAVMKLGFSNLVILRPSSLKGPRKEKRVLEKLSLPVLRLLTTFMFKKYRPIEGEIVATAMIQGILNPDPQKSIWEADEIFKLAGSL